MKYTKKQITEAIAYWKKILIEAETGEAGDSGDSGTTRSTTVAPVDTPPEVTAAAKDDDKKAKDDASNNPIQGVNILRRMFFAHNSAKKRVIKKLKSYLQKSKISAEPVIKNSGIDEYNGIFRQPEEQVLITIEIALDQVQVTGLRKLAAIIKENEQEIDEGFISTFFSRVGDAVKKGASHAAETGKQLKQVYDKKIDDALEVLKKEIGIKTMQEYVTGFMGSVKRGKLVNENNVFASMTEGKDGKSGILRFYLAIAMN